MSISSIIVENTAKYLTLLKERVNETYPDRSLYPNRTIDLVSYVETIIPKALHSYCLDINESSDRHVNMFISQLYKGQRRQTKNIDLQVEAWIHQLLVDMICLENDVTAEERSEIRKLWNVINDVFIGNRTYEDSYSYLENLVYNRTSFSKFKDTPVDDIKLETILNAANGLTPALASKFHYRVDVLPTELKEKMKPYINSWFDDCTQEVKDEYLADPGARTQAEWRDLGVCFNHQFDAPVVLAYSVPKHTTNRRWYPHEFPISRDATMIALGTNMWNTICSIEELGLNSCCLKAFQSPALDEITVNTNEDMPEGWSWEPFIFLCIGEGETPKGDHRKYKPAGIVNTLDIVSAH